MKVAIYVQHLLGTGHLVRMQQLAAALHGRGVTTTLIQGGQPVAQASTLKADTSNYAVIQLPVLKCRPGDFSTLLDEHGREVGDRFRAIRVRALLSAVARINPDVLVIETWPFGRRQMEFEILPLLESLRNLSTPTMVVSSVRDILQLRSRKRRQQTLNQLNAYVSLVLVHGDPDFIQLEKSFEEASQILCPVAYSGYIHTEAVKSGRQSELSLEPSDIRPDEVLVSAGGGAAAERLLEVATTTALGDHRRWRILAGSRPDPRRLAALRNEVAVSEGRVIVEPNRADFQSLLKHCGVSVSQYGYNTALDLFEARCAAVVVPYTDDGETEQAMRASLFAARGMIRICSITQLNPDSLTAAIDSAAKISPNQRLPMMDGTIRSVEILINHFYAQGTR